MINRAPRPWAMKLNAHRVTTSRRFSNPIRYHRCTVSQVTQASGPLDPHALYARPPREPARSWPDCPCRDSGSHEPDGRAADRGSLGQRGDPAASPPAQVRAARSTRRRTGELGSCRRSRSPRGGPAATDPRAPRRARLRSGTAPARLASTPASSDATTPAAQTTVRVSIRRGCGPCRSSATDRSSRSATALSSSVVTPSRASDRCALRESEAGNSLRTRSPASTSRIRASPASTD